MHLEFSYTFDDYSEANRAHLQRTAGGGPARFGLLVIFICVIVIGGSAFFEAARSTAPATATATPAAPQGGSSFAMEFLLPLLPWLLIFGFLWVFVFRRLTARKPPSFLFDSNADAERSGRRRWWPRVVAIALVVLGFLTVLTLLLANAAHAPGGNLVDALLPLSPWLVVFLSVWVFFFRLLRRQTRHNWEGQPNLHLENRMDIAPEGVSVANPVFSSAYRWEAFQRVQETPNLFILFLSTLTFVLIPKRALPDAQAIDSLRGTLRTMIAERPTPAFAVVMPAPPQ
jgi:heme/copper-type cytochrome/quinol oxidase subunit 2